MADVNANIGVHIDTSAALAELKALQRQLANFHSSVSKSSAAAAMAQKGLQTNLLNSINATGKFRAQMGLVRTSTESFTHALEKNKLSMREYFRYSGGSTRTFGKLFKQEFNTIGKVAEERVKKMQTQYIKMGRDASGAMKAISITPNTLNMKDYSTKLAVAAQKQAILNQLLRQGSTNLLNFGKNTQWAGRQLMVGFTVPLLYLGGAAAKVFMDLEKQAVRFKRVYGDMFTTTEETNKALKEIELLAQSFTKYGVAVVKTMEMAANAAAMGKTGADLTAQVAQATRLAVLGGVEQEQALETTISVTNAFGIAAEDLASKINFLNAVENQTVVSIEDLTEAIPKAGPVVKQLGGSVEDLAFFLTAMKEGGINASEGANALKSGLASLINPSKKASDMLASMGVNIKGIVEGNQGNIKETVIDFAQALDTLDPLNRARAIEQLFGKFQFSRLSTLFQNVTKDGTQASRVLQLATASVEELAIMSERELGTLEDAIGTDFKESIENLKLALAPIGKEFLKAITPVAKVLGNFLEKFNNLGDGTKKFIVVATALVGVIGPVLLMTFGLLANGVANIIKLFITMRTGFHKVGTQSGMLAQQTQYLNSEQLESLTVATSLGQAHARLTQSFATETIGVKLLRQAYIDATIAAAAFARTNPGMMMPGGKFTPGPIPKKFASGVDTVPGTGNKDTVPALLMPGEAVIPKKIAQDNRYAPIIDAMVNGTIQGFDDGTTGAGRFRALPAGTDVNAAIANIRAQVANTGGGANMVAGRRAAQQALYNKQDAALLQGLRGKTSTTPTLQGETVFAHAVDKKVVRGSALPANMQSTGFGSANAFSAIGFDLSPKTNAALITGKVRAGDYLRELNTPGSTTTMTARLIDLGIPPKDAVRVTERIKNNLSTSLSNMSPQSLIGDKQIYSRMGNLKTGILGGIVNKSKGGSFGNAVKSLYASTTFSPLGSSSLKFNGSAPIADVIKSVQGTKTSQSVIKALRNIQSIDPNYSIPVKRDASGKIIAYERPEVSARTGKISNTRSIAALDGDKFRTARVGRGGGRKLTPSKNATSIARELLTGQKSSGVITGQTGVAKPSALNVIGGAQSDNRQVAVGKNETILNKKTTTALRSGKGVSVPGIGRFGLIGADLGVPKGQSVTSPGMAVSAVEKQFRAEQKSLRRQITKVEKERVNALKQETKMIQEKTAITQQQIPLTKEQLKAEKKEARANRSAAIGRVAGPVAGIAGIGAMAGFMTGNTGVGTALMGVSALATIAPMLTNPFGIAVAAAATLAGGFFLLNKRMADARKKQIEYIDSVTSGTKQLQKVGELTGKVGASQIAQKQRETGARVNEFRTGFDREGNQFGTNFLASDIGKQIFKGFNDTVAKDGDKAAKLLATQLSTYISDGVMTAEQANSVARAIGVNLGDMGISAKINGELRSIVGPDGTDILKDPLKVRMNIIDAQEQNTEDLVAQSKKPNVNVKSFISAAAASAGKNLQITQAQRDAQYQTNQAVIDSLEKQRATTTDKAKQLQLEQQITDAKTKQKSEDTLLAEKSKQALNDSVKTFEGFASSDTYIKTLRDSIKINNKDNPFLQLFLDAGTALKNESLEVQISTAVDGGLLSLKTATDLMNMFAGDPDGETKIKTIMETTVTSQDPGVFQAFMGIVTGKDIDKKITLAILGDQENFEDRVKVLNRLKDLDGDAINLKVAVEQLGVKGLDKLAKSFKAIEKIKSPITVKTVSEIATITDDPFLNMSGLVDIWSKYENASDVIKKTVIQEYISIFKSIGESEVEDLINKELAKFDGSPDRKDEMRKRLEKQLYYYDRSGNKQTNNPELAKLLMSQRGVPAPNTIPKGDGAGGDGKGRRTELDDLLRQLKLTRDASIDAQGGLEELKKVFNEAGGDVTKFSGVIEQLNAMGADTGFIDFISGLDNETQATYLNVDLLEKGIVRLTDAGEKAMALYKEAALGAFYASSDSEIADLNAQVDGFNRLTKAGVGVADSLKLIANAEQMRALAQAKTPNELDNLIKKYKDLTAAQLAYLIKTDPAQAFKNRMEETLKYYDFLEREARASVKLEIDRINDLIDANDRLIETQERVIEESINRPIDKFNQDLAVIDKAIEKINEKYDAQEDALQKISEINDDIAARESSRITIADALTRGDISAAAKAIQERRAEEARRAKENSSKLLQIAREKEISKLTNTDGLTKIQIEEKIYSLEQQRIPLVAAIVKLQDDNYKLQNVTLRAQEDSLKATLKGIDAARFAYEQQSIAIEGANWKAKGFNDILLVAEATLLRMKKLWDEMNSKNKADVEKNTFNNIGTTVKAPNSASGISNIGDEISKYVSELSAETISTKYINAAQAEQYIIDQKINSLGLGPKYAGMLKGSLGMAFGGAVPKVRYEPIPSQIQGYNRGGVIPKYFVAGGYSRGSDTVPAMLTPGEFVVRRNAVESFGVNNLNKINDGSYGGSSVYNYSLNVNVKSDSSPDDIARTVMTQIKRIDNQRIKGQK